MYWIIAIIAIVAIGFLFLKFLLKISPLHKAIEEGRIDDAKNMIMGGVEVNTKNIMTCASPIYSAAIRNQIDIVKMLITKGASVKTSLRDGCTILHSIAHGNTTFTVELIDLLINNGFDINAIDKHGQTALFLACFRKDSSLADYLLEKGADVNSGKKTPIYAAASFSSASLVAKLIDKGANINDQSSPQKDTPLHYAATEGNIEVIKFLLEQGADTKLTNSLGRTALANASLKNNTEAVNLLKN